MLKEAVPYDFGGIDVIDELTMAPPKSKDSKKSEEEKKPERATPSPVSAPEEPSLTNVVSAAEDFIKVLATVSTSQSSAVDSDKGETQSSEKKKRKKKKKTSKKQKGKGKGRKRKLKAEAGLKVDEGAVVAPSGSKAKEVITLSNFINESHKYEQSSRNRNRIGDSEYELGGKEEPFNDVMKDEPVVDRDAVSVTSQMPDQEKLAEFDADVPTQEVAPSVWTSMKTVLPHKEKNRRLGKERKKKSRTRDTNTTNSTSATSALAIITTTPMAKLEQRGINNAERQPAASTLTVIPRVKKSRSKEREDREEGKKRRKVSLVSSIVAAGYENPSVDNLKVIPPTGAPTVLSIPTTERQVSSRLHVHGGQMTGPGLNSSYSVFKRQRSKERGGRNRKRKTLLPLSTESQFLPNRPENTLLHSTAGTGGSPDSPADAALMSRLTEKPESHSEWRQLTTAAPFLEPHRQTIRQQRKPRKPAEPAGVSVPPQQSEHSSGTPTPPRVTTTDEPTLAAPVLSPVQLSIEKAKAHFIRKKKKKVVLSNRQQ